MPSSHRPGRGPRKKKKRGSNKSGSPLPRKRSDEIRMDGVVTEILPNASCNVELVNGHTVLATMSGKMKRFRIRVLPGDKVTVQFTPYDLTRGQVVRREG